MAVEKSSDVKVGKMDALDKRLADYQVDLQKVLSQMNAMHSQLARIQEKRSQLVGAIQAMEAYKKDLATERGKRR